MKRLPFLFVILLTFVVSSCFFEEVPQEDIFEYYSIVMYNNGDSPVNLYCYRPVFGEFADPENLVQPNEHRILDIETSKTSSGGTNQSYLPINIVISASLNGELIDTKEYEINLHLGEKSVYFDGESLSF